MDWNVKYQREQQATWDELAESIKNAVTMREVIATYLPHLSPRGRRMPCPIHNGKGLNFSFSDTGFKCFVCNESGDVIEFVRIICSLRSRVDAMKQINNDFRLGLPIGRSVTQAESSHMKELRRKAREREAKEKLLLSIYHAALDRYIALDIMSREYSPEKDKDNAVYAQYVYAIKRIDEAWYKVEQAAQALNDFAKQEGDLKLTKAE